MRLVLNLTYCTLKLKIQYCKNGWCVVDTDVTSNPFENGLDKEFPNQVDFHLVEDESLEGSELEGLNETLDKVLNLIPVEPVFTTCDQIMSFFFAPDLSPCMHLLLNIAAPLGNFMHYLALEISGDNLIYFSNYIKLVMGELTTKNEEIRSMLDEGVLVEN